MSTIPATLPFWKRIKRRMVATCMRYEKQTPRIWSLRLNRVFFQFWNRFGKMPVSEKSMQWAERNMLRITKVKPPWQKD
jgi:hypothetical protein